MGKRDGNNTSASSGQHQLMDRYAPSSQPQVVFLLDITGSMGAQIDAVKGMVRSFCAMPRPDIDIHIWTYTESCDGCWVTRSPPKLNHDELTAYVDRVHLCQPPGLSVSAGGEDGPENLVAGLVTLLSSFDASHKIICFIITDAPPHLKSNGDSATARREKEWLTFHGFSAQENNGLGHDPYYLLSCVTESLNVSLVPVLYHTAANEHWLEQAAAVTDSITLRPTLPDSDTLRDGLVAVLEALQSVAINRSVDPAIALDLANRCRGFALRFPSPDFVVLTQEPPYASGASATSFTSDPKDLLEGLTGLLRTACDRFSGKRAVKRIRSVNIEVVQASIKLFAWTVLRLTGSTLDPAGSNWIAVADGLKKVLDILASLPNAEPEMKMEQKIVLRLFESLDAIRALADKRLEASPSSTPAAAAAGAADITDGIVCAVSLDSVKDVLQQLDDEVPPDTEEGLQTWMDLVLRSTMCRLVNVVFPLDATGQPDFFDAWASVVRGYSLSTSLSASSAAALRDKETGQYADPLTRSSFSVAVVVAHPDDAILTTSYRVLSSLPSLMGLVQGYLVSGNYKIFPSLAPGIQAATLFRIFQTLPPARIPTDAEWELVRVLAHSLRSFAGAVASDVARDLAKKGHFNPADAVPKLLAAAIRSGPASKTTDEKDAASTPPPEAQDADGLRLSNQRYPFLSLLFDEIAGDAIAFIRRKRGYVQAGSASAPFESDMPTDNEIANALFPETLADAFDPMVAYHPIELVTAVRNPASNSADSTAAKPSVDIVPKDAKLRFMNEVLRSSDTFRQLVHTFRNLSSVFFADLTVKQSSSIAWGEHTPLSEEQMLEHYFDNLLLAKRTKRYDLLEPASDNNWRLVSPETVTDRIATSVRELLQESYRDSLARWNTERAAAARKAIFDQVQALSPTANDTFDTINAQLAAVKHTILDKTYSLQRKDAVDLAPLVPQSRRESVLLPLILGSWSTSPPAELRRSCNTFLELFVESSEEIRELIKKTLNSKLCCTRSTLNRHGHTSAIRFPGYNHWTEEYEAARLGCFDGVEVVSRKVDRIKRILKEMKTRAAEIADIEKIISTSTATTSAGETVPIGDGRKALLEALVYISEECAKPAWFVDIQKKIVSLAELDQPDWISKAQRKAVWLKRTKNAIRKMRELVDSIPKR